MKLRKMPSMKGKSRYLFFSVMADGRLGYPEVKGAILNSLENWMGDKEFGRARIWVIRNLWNQSDLSGVIKCSHKSVDDIKVGLGLIHQIGDSRVIFRTTRVSGTLKAGSKKR